MKKKVNILTFLNYIIAVPGTGNAISNAISWYLQFWKKSESKICCTTSHLRPKRYIKMPCDSHYKYSCWGHLNLTVRLCLKYNDFIKEDFGWRETVFIVCMFLWVEVTNLCFPQSQSTQNVERSMQTTALYRQCSGVRATEKDKTENSLSSIR